VRELREELGVELSLPLGSPFGRLTDAATQIEMTIWLIDYDGAAARCTRESATPNCGSAVLAAHIHRTDGTRQRDTPSRRSAAALDQMS
jgi:hypothetical protein